MNRRLIIRVLGAILLVEAAAMLPALIVSLIYGDGDTAVMGLSIQICIKQAILVQRLVIQGACLP